MNQGAVVHIVDDDESFRPAVALKTAGYALATYSSAGEFLVANHASKRGCILLDVRMPGPSGLELQEAITRDYNSLPIIFVTGFGDVPTSVRAMRPST
jgi:FixJ family two-component response regulator